MRNHRIEVQEVESTQNKKRKMTQKEREAVRKRKKAWKIFAMILLLAQLVCSGVAIVQITLSKMLPASYMAVVWIVYLLAFVLVFVFLLMLKRRRGQKKKVIYWKRALGCIISAFVIFVSIFASDVMARLNTTLNNISTEQTIVTDMMAVYVRADDEATDLAKTADYRYGTATAFDYSDVEATLAKINQELHAQIVPTEYDSAFTMVDALYGGEIDAFIMNEAQESIIMDVEGYFEFRQQTKIVYEYEIQTIVEVPSDMVEEVEEPIDVTSDVFIVYISGSDTRNKKLSTSRSDVNILAVVNPTSKQVLLLNTPRDYYVPISVSSTGEYDKLTHCALYGIDCSMDTLSDLYDTRIDYYGQINFTGFETLIDAIGGISVESEKSFVTTHGEYQIVKGMNYLNGAQALGFVRERYAFSDGDIARGRNQMRVISAVINKLTSASTLLMNYADIMKSMEGMFVTDMSTDEIKSLVNMQLRDMGAWDIKSYYVTGANASRTTYSMPNDPNYVMLEDEEMIQKAKALIEKMKSGQMLTDADFE